MIQRANGRSHVSSPIAGRLPVSPASASRRLAWRQQLETCIAEHPVICIAAAVTLGAIAGWFVKRR